MPDSEVWREISKILMSGALGPRERAVWVWPPCMQGSLPLIRRGHLLVGRGLHMFIKDNSNHIPSWV